MSSDYPPVSIGLPVYNGSPLIRRAIESLLAQDYPNLEIIISDNASTDDTWEICQECAQKDSRLRIYRNPENMAITYNFNRVFELSRGEFYALTAHDDWLYPNYISACVQKLRENPESPLCYTYDLGHYQNPDEDVLFNENIHATDPVAWKRGKSLLFTFRPHSATYGVCRRSALEKVMPFYDVIGLDLVFLTQMAFLGPFCHVPEILRESSVKRKHVSKRVEEVEKTDRESLHIIQWRMFKAYIHAVWRSPLKFTDKLKMWLVILYWNIRWFIRRHFPDSIRLPLVRAVRVARRSVFR